MLFIILGNRTQAIYGKTGALYTRFELIRSLGLAKEHSRAVMDHMMQQESSVNEVVGMMEDQTRKVRAKPCNYTYVHIDL